MNKRKKKEGRWFKGNSMHAPNAQQLADEALDDFERVCRVLRTDKLDQASFTELMTSMAYSGDAVAAFTNICDQCSTVTGHPVTHIDRAVLSSLYQSEVYTACADLKEATRSVVSAASQEASERQLSAFLSTVLSVPLSRGSTQEELAQSLHDSAAAAHSAAPKIVWTSLDLANSERLLQLQIPQDAAEALEGFGAGLTEAGISPSKYCVTDADRFELESAVELSGAVRARLKEVGACVLHGLGSGTRMTHTVLCNLVGVSSQVSQRDESDESSVDRCDPLRAS
jgi:hypothetical protein